MFNTLLGKILHILSITQCWCLLLRQVYIATLWWIFTVVSINCSPFIYWHNYFPCSFSITHFLLLLSFIMQFLNSQVSFLVQEDFWVWCLFSFPLSPTSAYHFFLIRKWGPYFASSVWNANYSCSQVLIGPRRIQITVVRFNNSEETMTKSFWK